jgi:dihydrofolate reductase
MGKVVLAMSMSLDGFIAAPGDGPDQTLGMGGDRLHAWIGQDRTDQGAHILEEGAKALGALIMGRRTYDFSGGPHAWGEDGPVPCFVLSHRVPEHITAPEVFTFVHDGIESALAQAQAAAGNKNIGLMGANIAQQYLGAGFVDEIEIALVPILLGDGIRLFDRLSRYPLELECIKVIQVPGVTHLSFYVKK